MIKEPDWKVYDKYELCCDGCGQVHSAHQSKKTLELLWEEHFGKLEPWMTINNSTFGLLCPSCATDLQLVRKG